MVNNFINYNGISADLMAAAREGKDTLLEASLLAKEDELESLQAELKVPILLLLLAVKQSWEPKRRGQTALIASGVWTMKRALQAGTKFSS